MAFEGGWQVSTVGPGGRYGGSGLTSISKASTTRVTGGRLTGVGRGTRGSGGHRTPSAPRTLSTGRGFNAATAGGVTGRRPATYHIQGYKGISQGKGNVWKLITFAIVTRTRDGFR